MSGEQHKKRIMSARIEHAMPQDSHRKDKYNSPEIVRLGEALELTTGSPDLPLSDARPKPNGYKDI